MNASSNPADVRTAAVAEPPADQPQDAAPVLQPALQQPAPGIALAAANSSTTKPTASLQMLLVVMAAALALAGITVSLRLQAGPHPRAARHARHRRAMWDSAKAEAASATNSFGTADTVQHRRRGQRHRRVRRPPMRSAAAERSAHPRKPGRGVPGGCAHGHVRRRRVRARKRRGSGRLPTCWPGSPAAPSRNRNGR